MNHIAARDEIERIRAIVARHHLPSFVRGYDVEVGEFDGTPALWIEFKVTPYGDRSIDGLLRRGEDLVELIDTVQPALFNEIDGRYPFFRFSETVPDSTPLA